MSSLVAGGLAAAAPVAQLRLGIVLVEAGAELAVQVTREQHRLGELQWERQMIVVMIFSLPVYLSALTAMEQELPVPGSHPDVRNPPIERDGFNFSSVFRV